MRGLAATQIRGILRDWDIVAAIAVTLRIVLAQARSATDVLGHAQLFARPRGQSRGQRQLVANYDGANVATNTKGSPGPIGPAQAKSALQGSFALSGHDRTHADIIEADRTGRFVLASDLGMDLIFI